MSSQGSECPRTDSMKVSKDTRGLSRMPCGPALSGLSSGLPAHFTVRIFSGRNQTSSPRRWRENTVASKPLATSSSPTADGHTLAKASVA